MKRFITKKKIKIPRYKLLYIMIFFCIILVILINFIIRIFFSVLPSDKVIDVFTGNAYGNIFYSYNKQNNLNTIFKNAFGFPLLPAKSSMSENNSVKDFISEPTIYLYNTFQTDKYVNNYYSSYSINPVIIQANYILEEYLKKRGYSVLIEKGSVAKVLKENNLSYTLSYRGSRILMEEAKKNNPSLEYFFDIGMSDDKKDITTLSYSGNSYARILFIVGTEYASSGENKEFAQSWNQKLEERMPGLSRGVSLRGGAGYHGIYNQDFSSNTLLIYIGGKENTIDEVNRSLEVLALSFNDLVGGNNEKK